MLCMGLIAAFSAGMVGCGDKKKDDKKTEKKTDGKTVPETKDNKIAVAAKPDSEKLDAGKSAEVEITVTRGKDAKEKEVTLSVSVDPDKKGVTAKLDPDKLAKDKDKSKLTIETTDAADGEYKVTVKGKADEEGSATVTVKVAKKAAKVVEPKKDKLAIEGPKDVTIKQGKEGTAKVTVTLGADLAKGATLKAWVKDEKDKDPKDVKVKLDLDKLAKSGDAIATITVGEAAAPGSYTLTVEATAEGGAPAAAKVTVKVDKK
jgi:hypothetical protein